MAQAMLGLKSAYEKAGKDPSPEQIAAALEHLEFDTPSGKIKMAIGKGHQAIEPTVYGRAKTVNGKLTFTDVKQFPAEKVNPPGGREERGLDQEPASRPRCDAASGRQRAIRWKPSSPIVVDGVIHASWLFIMAAGLTNHLRRDAHPQHGARQPLRAGRVRRGEPSPGCG